MKCGNARDCALDQVPFRSREWRRSVSEASVARLSVSFVLDRAKTAGQRQESNISQNKPRSFRRSRVKPCRRPSCRAPRPGHPTPCDAVNHPEGALPSPAH